MMWGWDTIISPRWGFVEGDVGLGYNNVGSLGFDGRFLRSGWEE